MELHPVLPHESSIKDCPTSVRLGLHNSKFSSLSVSDNNNSSSNSPAEWLLPTPRYASKDFKLTKSQVNQFLETGVLIIKREDIWNEDEMKLLLSSVNIMDNWADSPGKYMKYYEDSKVDGSKILCRIENFNDYNPGLSYFCNGQKLVGACSQLFGEEAILYKEKINYKIPGSAGFVPHQDVAAGWWMYGQSLHISVLVSVDPATLQNGCLEVALGEHKKGMLSDPWTELSPETSDKLKFIHVPTQPGDVIFFDSYVPHKSEANKTDKPRRVLYATYAKESEGNYRERYYSDKRMSFPPDCEREQGKKYEYKV